MYAQNTQDLEMVTATKPTSSESCKLIFFKLVDAGAEIDVKKALIFLSKPFVIVINIYTQHSFFVNRSYLKKKTITYHRQY